MLLSIRFLAKFNVPLTEIVNIFWMEYSLIWDTPLKILLKLRFDRVSISNVNGLCDFAEVGLN